MRSQRLRGVGVQIDGAIVVAGDVQGTMDLGGPPIVTAGPYPDTVLAALDPGGPSCGSGTSRGRRAPNSPVST